MQLVLSIPGRIELTAAKETVKITLKVDWNVFVTLIKVIMQEFLSSSI
jgi:hypothetical protein